MGGRRGKRGRAREEMRPRGRMHAHLHEKARTHMNPQYANHERNQPEVPQLRVESQVGPVRGMYYTQRTHTRADLAAAAVASGTWRASSAPVAPCLAGGTVSSLHARPPPALRSRSATGNVSGAWGYAPGPCMPFLGPACPGLCCITARSPRPWKSRPRPGPRGSSRSET